MKHALYALWCFEELLEASCVAVGHQVSVVRGGEKRAVHNYMLYGLNGFAALACDLVWSVLREEPLSILPCEGVPCNEAVKSRMG